MQPPWKKQKKQNAFLHKARSAALFLMIFLCFSTAAVLAWTYFVGTESSSFKTRGKELLDSASRAGSNIWNSLSTNTVNTWKKGKYIARKSNWEKLVPDFSTYKQNKQTEELSDTSEQKKDIEIEVQKEERRKSLVISDEDLNYKESKQTRKALSASADLDGDGDRDTVKVEPDKDQIVWYENLPGDAEDIRRVIAGETRAITSMSAKDLDDDGDIDVKVNTYEGLELWYENNGKKPPGWVGHVK